MAHRRICCVLVLDVRVMQRVYNGCTLFGNKCVPYAAAAVLLTRTSIIGPQPLLLQCTPPLIPVSIRLSGLRLPCASDMPHCSKNAAFIGVGETPIKTRWGYKFTTRTEKYFSPNNLCNFTCIHVSIDLCKYIHLCKK